MIWEGVCVDKIRNHTSVGRGCIYCCWNWSLRTKLFQLWDERLNLGLRTGYESLDPDPGEWIGGWMSSWVGCIRGGRKETESTKASIILILPQWTYKVPFYSSGVSQVSVCAGWVVPERRCDFCVHPGDAVIYASKWSLLGQDTALKPALCTIWSHWSRTQHTLNTSNEDFAFCF